MKHLRHAEMVVNHQVNRTVSRTAVMMITAAAAVELHGVSRKRLQPINSKSNVTDTDFGHKSFNVIISLKVIL